MVLFQKMSWSLMNNHESPYSCMHVYYMALKGVAIWCLNYKALYLAILDG